MHTAISRCRICGGGDLEHVLNLGEQALTGVFPRARDQHVTRGPLELVKCMADGGCGLLQLAHSYDLGEMYGDNYGYRSGLNDSMVKHLHAKAARISTMVDLSDHPLVLDIGSNDGTTLGAPSFESCTRIGMDPSAAKFAQYYPDGAIVISDFFSQERFGALFPDGRARVVTSFSMFYDLESPMDFMHEVASILEDQGIWVLEQSYMPLMLQRNSYDTVCHEHFEYYALRQIKWMADRVSLKIIDVEFNDVNGGSFSVVLARSDSAYPGFAGLTGQLEKEFQLGLDTLLPYREFRTRVEATGRALRMFVEDVVAQGKRVAGLGASTKGNVILQYCGLSPRLIYAIGEVNPEKFGCYTPGTEIPIVPETELLAQEPDYLIVLPWHFKAFFVNRYRLPNTKLVFPLPTLEVI